MEDEAELECRIEVWEGAAQQRANQKSDGHSSTPDNHFRFLQIFHTCAYCITLDGTDHPCGQVDLRVSKHSKMISIFFVLLFFFYLIFL